MQKGRSATIKHQLSLKSYIQNSIPSATFHKQNICFTYTDLLGKKSVLFK